jgi:hypothetical protein
MLLADDMIVESSNFISTHRVFFVPQFNGLDRCGDFNNTLTHLNLIITQLHF